MSSRIAWLIAGLLLHLYAEVAIWLPLVYDRHLGLYPRVVAILWCVSALWVLVVMWQVNRHGKRVEADKRRLSYRNQYLFVDRRGWQDRLRHQGERELESANERITELTTVADSAEELLAAVKAQGSTEDTDLYISAARLENILASVRHSRGIWTVNEMRQARGEQPVSGRKLPVPNEQDNRTETIRALDDDG